MKIGVPKELYPGERRVALDPLSVGKLVKKEFEVLVEKGAGERAAISDSAYEAKGATIVADRAELLKQADVVAYVRGLGACPEEGRADLEHYREGQYVLGHMEPLSSGEEMKALAESGVRTFALELLPRITRAQSMDVLSSMATIAGYKAVLLAANEVPRMFPMMMTAAGTVHPTKVFVVGVGVAGLQAIATAKRLGAVVHAYDIRPAVKEQVVSLGAKFVEFDLETKEAESSGGYAKAMDEDFYRKQREMMTKVVAENDIVITTAAVPGKKAPLLVTEEMIRGMKPGSAVIDLAAERGGNCEPTKPGEWVDLDGVKVYGPLNVASTLSAHASQMYATNVTNFLLHVFSKGSEGVDFTDEITGSTLVTRDKEIVNEAVRENLGLSPMKKEEEAPSDSAGSSE